jgi:phage protein D
MSATSEHYVALCTILVDGAPLDDRLARKVRDVRVVSYLRLPDVCTLSAVFEKAQDGQPQPIDQHPFEIGKPIEVQLGAREALTTTTLFKGQIVTLEPKFGSGGVELLVRGFDRSHVLLRSRNVRTFQNQTSSDIVAKVVQEAGLEVECEPSGEPHEFIEQDNETDWDFIWRLAERCGFEFIIEDQRAKFRPPTPEDAIELEWPTVLRSFNPRVTAVQQVQEVSLSALDPKTKQPIDVTASSSNQIAQIGVAREDVANAFSGAKIHVASEPVKSQSEGTALAQALLDKLANGYVAAEGITDGNPKVRAGAKVNVTGVGQKFSGLYYVATATHVFRGGGTYETHFANSPAHTLLGSVGADRGRSAPDFGSQLVLGLVTNNQDPENLGRVRVRYPALGDDAEGTWARIATPSAGNERGLLMLPVAGEEVLVGFEHGDTTRPYVLGSLFNGVDTPGDDLLHSQGGSFVVKSDKEIYLQSSEDFTVKSGANLNAESGANATLKSQQAIEIDGQNVTIKGQAQVNLEGNATLTLKCGGSQIQLSSAGVQVSGPMITLG